MLAAAIVCFVLALIPCLLFIRNSSMLHAPDLSLERPSLSVLIPARNEAANIGRALQSVLAGGYPNLEIIVLDDHSTDDTARIVEEIAAQHPQVRLIRGADLPEGWYGKNFALHQLAGAASSDWLLFLDADVRLSKDALQRLASCAGADSPDLVSGVPRQITRGFLEQLMLPLIHFVLLGFLPLQRMRRTTDPAACAAIGQLLLCRRSSYHTSGGHEGVRGRIHDGLALARQFRKAGFHTDLIDATPIASVRMYDSARGVWHGLVKNAHEGMGAPRLIVPMTLLLAGGQIAPVVLRATHPEHSVIAAWGAAAILLSYAPRALAAGRFRQSWLSVLLHPLGILLLIIIQWEGLIRHMLKRPVAWRGRAGAAP
jgi:glycosyltransferase involved in cell wall biosynthesis